MSQILSAFNNHFTEFVEDIKRVFPDDIDIATAANALAKLRKANPKMIIMAFKQFVSLPYKKEIEAGEIEFFINKDYSQDVGGDSASLILSKIDLLRKPVSEMNENEQKKVIKYIQNLTKLADLYN
tara:strand:- start:2516 stop:2893 length:378 start_codon:yes stop_codon:yes gene_type:complete